MYSNTAFARGANVLKQLKTCLRIDEKPTDSHMIRMEAIFYITLSLSVLFLINTGILLFTYKELGVVHAASFLLSVLSLATLLLIRYLQYPLTKPTLGHTCV